MLCAVALIAGQPQPDAQTSPIGLLEKDFPTLVARVGANEPADYVVAVDVSGSMKGFWPAVIRGVTSFVEAVPNGDYVSLVAFGTTARYLATPGAMSDESRSLLLDALRALPPPVDQRTDLGAGLAQTLDELNRPGGSTLKFVFVFTDFKHEPPGGSPYASFDSRHSAWEALRQRRQTELRGKILQVSGLVLPLEKAVGIHFPLVRHVLPEAEEVPIADPATLLNWFERRKAEIAREKLKLRVVEDLRQPALTVEGMRARAGPFASTGEILARVRGRSLRLVDVPAARVAPAFAPARGAADLNLQAVSPTEVRLRGDEDTTLAVGRFTIPRRPWIRTTRTVDVPLKLQVALSPDPRSEIERLGLAQASIEQSVTHRATLALPVGLFPVWLPAGVAGVLALALGTVGYVRRTEFMVGTVAVVGRQPRVVRKAERRTEIKIGNVEPHEGVRVEGALWQVHLRTARPGDGSDLARGTYVRVTGGTGRLSHRGRMKPMGTNWVPLPRGSAMEIGSTTINWS